MLGAGAEVKLAKKRVGLRITVMGAADSGKTSLINAFVNNIFLERQPSTEHLTLYYASYSVPAEEDVANSPNFNALLEIEDTPAFEHMDDKFLENLYDPFWPKPQWLAEARIPRDDYDKATQRLVRSINLPFSTCDPPVGKLNERGNATFIADSARHDNSYFCGQVDNTDRKCHPSTDHQCKSCRRFQASILPNGEYKPMVRRRMAYLLVFDATDKDSYLKTLSLFRSLQEALAKKNDLKQWPLIYLVGNKIDKDPELQSFKEIQSHLQEFAQTEIENGRKLSTAMVSAARNKYLGRLFKTIMQDLRTREPLWKVDPLGGDGEGVSDDQKCTVQ